MARHTDGINLFNTRQAAAKLGIGYNYLRQLDENKGERPMPLPRRKGEHPIWTREVLDHWLYHRSYRRGIGRGYQINTPKPETIALRKVKQVCAAMLTLWEARAIDGETLVDAVTWVAEGPHDGVS